VRLAADELAALLRAHAYVHVDRPPTLWDLDTHSLEAFIRVTGEFLAAGLARNGGELSALRLGVSNVVVAPEAAGSLPAGQYVAVSIAGSGRWADGRWRPGTGDQLISPDLTRALAGAGAVHAYSRMLGADSGAVTALFTRHLPTAEPPTAEPRSRPADPAPPTEARDR
jgi:hypothetical protein